VGFAKIGRKCADAFTETTKTTINAAITRMRISDMEAL
jgi:hypothetical protein